MSGAADAVLNVVTLGGYGAAQDAKQAAKRQEAETKRLLAQSQEAKPPIEKFRRRQGSPMSGLGALPSAFLKPTAGTDTPLLGQ